MVSLNVSKRGKKKKKNYTPKPSLQVKRFWYNLALTLLLKPGMFLWARGSHVSRTVKRRLGVFGEENEESSRDGHPRMHRRQRKEEGEKIKMSLEWNKNCFKPLCVGNPCIALAAVPLCSGTAQLVSAPVRKPGRNRLSSAFYASAVQKETTEKKLLPVKGSCCFTSSPPLPPARAGERHGREWERRRRLEGDFAKVPKHRGQKFPGLSSAWDLAPSVAGDHFGKGVEVPEERR